MLGKTSCPPDKWHESDGFAKYEFIPFLSPSHQLTLLSYFPSLNRTLSFSVLWGLLPSVTYTRLPPPACFPNSLSNELQNDFNNINFQSPVKTRKASVIAKAWLMEGQYDSVTWPLSANWMRCIRRNIELIASYPCGFSWWCLSKHTKIQNRHSHEQSIMPFWALITEFPRASVKINLHLRFTTS